MLWRAHKTLFARFVVLMVLLGGTVAAMADDKAIDFIAVTGGDKDYEKADAGLREELGRRTHIHYEDTGPENYGKAITDVLNHQNEGKPFVARLTPYAFLAAELQGAHLHQLATYLSGRNQLTYRAWFAIRWTDKKREPTLHDVTELLKTKGVRRGFGYHDKFSTSSYFLPSLYFRRENIYDTEKSTDKITAIEAHEISKSSSDLVAKVADGKATIEHGKLVPVDIVAVWDGTKEKISADYPNVRFVQLEEVLPNDLLVCSADLKKEDKQALEKAIEDMPCAPGQASAFGSVEFRCWTGIEKAKDTRKALSELRRKVVTPPPPVTVKVFADDLPKDTRDREEKQRQLDEYVNAVREAIRLAGTEFVAFDREITSHAIVDWKVALIHDGAISLTSTINDVDRKKLKPQEFPISFTNTEADLPNRVVTLMHTRMNRIRYIWPYETLRPTILRDVSFAPDNVPLVVQKVELKDPETNDYKPIAVFSARIIDSGKDADFHKFWLDGQDLPKDNETKELKFDPLSNVAYQVILVPPNPERTLFQVLTVALVALFVIAAAAAARELRRAYRARALQSAPAVAGEPAVVPPPAKGAPAG